jgi:Acetyltransferase (GNAT) domain
MTVYAIDPLRDSRWPDLLQQHPRASVFHSRGWLEALKQTYGYGPVAYTTTAPGKLLGNGWVFCRINSWLTGRRLVSLPFSDHCDALADNNVALDEIGHALQQEQAENHYKYVECRFSSCGVAPEGFEKHEEFCLHKLNLQPDLDDLFCALHKNSTQRKIRRAEKEELTYEQGSSEQLLDRFYGLLLLTRRRHRVPPQPRNWFVNLLKCFGTDLTICVASCKGMPAASIVTLRFKNTVVYKYGATDARFFPLGGMQLLFWRAIAEAKRSGIVELDLGRSDMHARGLLVLKDRLGASRSSLNYFRYPAGCGQGLLSDGASRRKGILSRVPGPLIAIAGRSLYRHFG